MSWTSREEFLKELRALLRNGKLGSACDMMKKARTGTAARELCGDCLASSIYPKGSCFSGVWAGGTNRESAVNDHILLIKAALEKERILEPITKQLTFQFFEEANE